MATLSLFYGILITMRPEEGNATISRISMRGTPEDVWEFAERYA